MALDILKQTKIVGKEGSGGFQPGGKRIGIYFSAHWCPPCRGFTPVLVDFYNKLKAAPETSERFEVVFVSSDRSPEDWQGYYDTMPWRAVHFTDGKEGTEKLKALMEVRGIPFLVIIDGDSGEIISTDGRKQVMENTDNPAKAPFL